MIFFTRLLPAAKAGCLLASRSFLKIFMKPKQFFAHFPLYCGREYNYIEDHNYRQFLRLVEPSKPSVRTVRYAGRASGKPAIIATPFPALPLSAFSTVHPAARIALHLSAT